MNTINTALAVASMFTAPAFTSPALAASKTDPIFGGNILVPDLWFGSFWAGVAHDSVTSRDRVLADGILYHQLKPISRPVS